jgi:hypothetical protein
VENNQKLLEQIKALLHAEGYDNITAHTTADSFTVAGNKGEGGAVFHCAAQRLKTGSSRTVDSAHSGRAVPEGAIAPSFANLHRQLASVSAESRAANLPPPGR